MTQPENGRLGRALAFAGLGVLSPFVAILGAEPFAVPGQNSLQEQAGASIALILYFAISQFWATRTGGRGWRGNRLTLVAMDAALLVMSAFVLFAEPGMTQLSFAVVMLVSGVVGSVAGVLLGWAFMALRGEDATPGAVALVSWRRWLWVGTGVFVVVALLLALGVIPAVKADTFPGAAPQRAALAFWWAVGLSLLAAAMLGLVPFWTRGRIRFERLGMGFAALLAFILGLATAGAGAAFRSHGPSMRGAVIVLFVCVVLYVVDGLLVVATAWLLPKHA
jgi:hypothetical protein